MSNLKHLLEKMDQFAGQAVGQKPGDQVRGTEKATKKKSGEHPFKGRLVGASESTGSLLRELEQELNRPAAAVKRDLFREFKEFKQEAEGDAEGLPHLTRELASHIRDQIDTEGPHAICKSVEWGDGAATELTELIKMALEKFVGDSELSEGFNPADTVQLDIPLLIRLLEYAKEDAQTDMDLHNVAERLIDMSSAGDTLSMDQYDAIVGRQVDEQVTPTTTPGAAPAAATNPAAVAQMKAQQLKTLAAQKKATQDQIKQTQDQLNALRKQLSQLSSPANIAMPGATGIAE